jgi:hypothetical protein
MTTTDTATTSRRQPPLWLVEGLDIAELRRGVVVGVAVGVCALGVLLAFLAPGIVPPVPWVGAAVAVAGLLLGLAAGVAVDTADLTVRGPRHVGAAGGELVAVLPADADADAAAPLAEAVLEAREDDTPLLLGLAAVGRDARAVVAWADALAVAIARTGASVLALDLADGRSERPGLLEVTRGERSLVSTVTFEPGLRLARLPAGREHGPALEALGSLPERLPRDLDVLVVSLPLAASRQVVSGARGLDHVLLLAERDRSSRIDLIAALDAMETAGNDAQVTLLDDRTVHRLGGPPGAGSPATDVDTGPDDEPIEDTLAGHDSADVADVADAASEAGDTEPQDEATAAIPAEDANDDRGRTEDPDATAVLAAEDTDGADDPDATSAMKAEDAAAADDADATTVLAAEDLDADEEPGGTEDPEVTAALPDDGTDGADDPEATAALASEGVTASDDPETTAAVAADDGAASDDPEVTAALAGEDADDASSLSTVPTPIPDPTPAPDPSPIPDPTPDPTPAPDPSPFPDPTPDPTPAPDPSPFPDPTPDPTPAPAPLPASEAAPAPPSATNWADDPAVISSQVRILRGPLPPRPSPSPVEEPDAPDGPRGSDGGTDPDAPSPAPADDGDRYDGPVRARDVDVVLGAGAAAALADLHGPDGPDPAAPDPVGHDPVLDAPVDDQGDDPTDPVPRAEGSSVGGGPTDDLRTTAQLAILMEDLQARDERP